MAILKKQTKIQKTSIGKDMEKLEPLFTDGGDVKRFSQYGKQFLKKFKIGLSYDPATPLWLYTSI